MGTRGCSAGLKVVGGALGGVSNSGLWLLLKEIMPVGMGSGAMVGRDVAKVVGVGCRWWARRMSRVAVSASMSGLLAAASAV